MTIHLFPNFAQALSVAQMSANSRIRLYSEEFMVNSVHLSVPVLWVLSSPLHHVLDRIMKCLVAAHYGQTSFVLFFKNKFAKLSHAVMFFIERRHFQLLKSFSNRTVMNLNIYHVHWGLSLTWSSFLFRWVLNSLTLGRDAGTWMLQTSKLQNPQLL